MSLEPCPSSPNCVCSQQDPSDTGHFIAPLGYAGTASDALDVIAEMVESTPRASVAKRTDTRLDAIYVSRVFRFKDDVSFLVDTDDAKIHFRSASRVGHSDFGVNRKRVDALKSQLQSRL